MATAAAQAAHLALLEATAAAAASFPEVTVHPLHQLATEVAAAAALTESQQSRLVPMAMAMARLAHGRLSLLYHTRRSAAAAGVARREVAEVARRVAVEAREEAEYRREKREEAIILLEEV